MTARKVTNNNTGSGKITTKLTEMQMPEDELKDLDEDLILGKNNGGDGNHSSDDAFLSVEEEPSPEQVEEDRKFVMEHEKARMAKLAKEREDALKKAIDDVKKQIQEETAPFQIKGASRVWLGSSSSELTVEQPVRLMKAVSHEKEIYYSLPDHTDRPDEPLYALAGQDTTTTFTPSFFKKTGYLMKKGGGTGTLSRRNWKSRYFLLHSDVLTYHEKPSSPELGKIGVETIRRITRTISDADFGFTVITTSRYWEFKAETDQEREEWITALTEARRQLSSSIPFTPPELPATLIF